MQALRRFVAVTVTLLLLGLSGCFSIFDPPSNQGTSLAPAITYQAYTVVKSQVQSDTVIALVSYTSSAIQRTDYKSWAEYTQAFDSIYRNIQRTKRLSSNYPVNPNEQELSVWQTFTGTWVNEMIRLGVVPSAGREQFSSDAAKFIFKVIDNEYTRQ